MVIYGGFSVNVRELMSRNFHVLRLATSLVKALEIFPEATELDGRRILGLMVINADDHLVGVLSMSGYPYPPAAQTVMGG